RLQDFRSPASNFWPSLVKAVTAPSAAATLRQSFIGLSRVGSRRSATQASPSQRQPVSTIEALIGCGAGLASLASLRNTGAALAWAANRNTPAAAAAMNGVLGMGAILAVEKGTTGR